MFACVVFPDVSPINLADSYESCRFEFIRAVLRNNSLDLYLKPKWLQTGRLRSVSDKPSLQPGSISPTGKAQVYFGIVI